MSDTAKKAHQILFQKSLSEVVRKLRSSKGSEKEVIAECIGDIKSEITSKVQNVKVMAVVKLTYFTMLGYSADYGAFNVIEVMADPSYVNKRVGYVAASLTFNEHTDVLPLCTALLKRDLASGNQYEIGLALYCLSSVCTPDLAKDLVSDVVSLLNHQRSYVRKKAILCLYKVFLQFPESLRPTFPRLKEKLDDNSDRSDNDPAVRGAIVNIFCEMSRRNPQNFLNLAVPFFSLLSTVHNNWTLIKIVKVFGYFAPLEPRLGKKLVEPITNLISTTGAKSVQYECIFAVANGMSRVSSVTKLAVEKMKVFVEDSDQNLKFLGLDAMSRVMLETPKVLADQRDTVLSCLDDSDVTIRRKALELLKGMTTKKNLVSTINYMFDRCVRTPPDEEWSNNVIRTIIETASYDDYVRVQDFEWYTGVLLDLAQIELSHFRHGALIESELVTVLTRVNAVRQFGVESLCSLLSNTAMLNCDTKRSTQWSVLKAAAFVCGEFPYWLPDKRLAIVYLLADRIALLPSELQVLCVAAVGKIHAYMCKPCARHIELVDGEETLEAVEDLTTLEDAENALFPPSEGVQGLHKGLDIFCHSVFPDVQERAQVVSFHVKQFQDLKKSADGDVSAYTGHLFYEVELKAVAHGAQEAVGQPDDLDLETPFCDNIPALVPMSDDDEDEAEESSDEEDVAGYSEEANKRRAKARRNEVDAFYIRDGSHNDDLPPVVKLDSLNMPPANQSPGGRRAAGGKKTHTMSRQLSRPDSYVSPHAGRRSASPGEGEDEATKRLRNIDLTKALTAEEKLPEATPYSKLASPNSKYDILERPAEIALTEPIIALETKTVMVNVTVHEAKAKKEGTRLSVEFQATNLTAGSSLYDVQVSIVEEHETMARLVAAEEKKAKKSSKHDDHDDNDEDNNTGDGGSHMIMADRIKATANCKPFPAVLVFPSIPDSMEEPLRLQLTFKKDKKEHVHEMVIPLKFNMFVVPTDVISAAVTPDLFNTQYLPLLESAPVATATIPIAEKKKKKKKGSKKLDNASFGAAITESERLAILLGKIRSRFRVCVMDTFKDCVTLYAQQMTRKSHADASHIAIMMKHEEEPTEETGGLQAVTFAVKGQCPGLVDAAIQELVALSQEEI